MAKGADGLTEKQQLFVREYLVDFNATQAAIRAGYSEKTANVIGFQNLTKVYIADALRGAIEERKKRVEIDADFVINGIREVTMDAKADGEKSVALKGFELLGKHLALFTEKTQHTGDVGVRVFTNVPMKDGHTL